MQDRVWHVFPQPYADPEKLKVSYCWSTTTVHQYSFFVGNPVLSLNWGYMGYRGYVVDLI